MSDDKPVPVDPIGFMEDLGRAFPEGYDDRDRYAEFRHVLMGSAAGQRVLHAILAWSHINELSFHPFMANEPANIVAFREGQRHIGLQVLATLEKPPVEVSTKAITRRP